MPFQKFAEIIPHRAMVPRQKVPRRNDDSLLSRQGGVTIATLVPHGMNRVIGLLSRSGSATTPLSWHSGTMAHLMRHGNATTPLSWHDGATKVSSRCRSRNIV